MGAAVKAQAKDFQETMDFLELAFKEHNNKEPRFERLFPDLYQPADEAMGNVVILRDDASGKIASSAGLFPIKLKLWGQPLTAQGVGGVGTLPEFRGSGLMNQVLMEINAELQRRNPPFAWLSGLRHRYGVWGYEKAGTTLLACLSKRTVKALKPSGFEVSELTFASIPLEGIIALRDASPESAGNASVEELKLKYSRPFLRFFSAKKDGASSFAVVADNSAVADWFGSSEGLADIALKLLQEVEGLQIRLPLDGTNSFAAISPLVEDHSIIMQGNFAVVDLAGCLKLLCDSPAAQELPSKGRRSVGFVMEAGPNPEQSARLSIDNGVLSAEKGLSGSEATVIKLSPMKMAALLFGPLKPLQLLGEEAPTWLDTLLPLPVYIPRIYGV